MSKAVRLRRGDDGTEWFDNGIWRLLLPDAAAKRRKCSPFCIEVDSRENEELWMDEREGWKEVRVLVRR